MGLLLTEVNSHMESWRVSRRLERIQGRSQNPSVG